MPSSAAAYSGNQISDPTQTIAAYDAAGNQSLVNGNTLQYDAESRQTSVQYAGATESYLYDADGKRVEKTGLATTVFVYDALGRMAAEYSNATENLPCTTCYLSQDHLGTARMITDQSGKVVARHDYLPFGEEIASGSAGRVGSSWGPSADLIKQKFTGKERDSESGLDYFGARYYGSALGRFTSPDWSASPQAVPYASLSNPQTLNQYAYVANNPLSRSDMDGHNWWDKFKNLFGWAGCWCEGEKAESAALRNLNAEERRQQVEKKRQQQEVVQWRIAYKNPLYHVGMAMAMGPLGPAGEELEAAGAETAAVEEAAEEEAGQMAAAEAKGYEEMAEQGAAASEQTAKKIARQIQRDLGPEARREFHDAKEAGAGDRTLQELRRDAKALYEEHGKTPPAWINK